MERSLPKISCCIKTYNEEKHIGDCLKSIFEQHYPKKLLEVILIDDKSTDRTVAIAKQFPVKVFFSGKKDPDFSMTMGFRKSSGRYFTVVDPDMRLKSKYWFQKMVKTLEENPDMPAAFTRYYAHKNDSLITRYLNLDPIQRDLLYQMFSTGFDEVIVQNKSGYYVCEYSEDKIPPQVHGLYRVSALKKVLKKQKIYYDMGNLIMLVKCGYKKFGYVPDAGYYHFHADSLRSLLKKRIRSVKQSYLRYNNKSSHFKWFDLTSSRDIVKLTFLIIGANLFFPIFILSLFKMIRRRIWLYLLEAPLTILLVDVILLAFLSDRRGREMIKNTLFI